MYSCPVSYWSTTSNSPDRSASRVRSSHSAYRASGAWWERDAWTTEEWDVETDDGLFRLRRDGDAWLVEGSYDE